MTRAFGAGHGHCERRRRLHALRPPFVAEIPPAIVGELDALLADARARSAVLTASEEAWWLRHIRQAKGPLCTLPPEEIATGAAEVLAALEWARPVHAGAVTTGQLIESVGVD